MRDPPGRPPGRRPPPGRRRGWRLLPAVAAGLLAGLLVLRGAARAEVQVRPPPRGLPPSRRRRTDEGAAGAPRTQGRRALPPADGFLRRGGQWLWRRAPGEVRPSPPPRPRPPPPVWARLHLSPPRLLRQHRPAGGRKGGCRGAGGAPAGPWPRTRARTGPSHPPPTPGGWEGGSAPLFLDPGCMGGARPRPRDDPAPGPAPAAGRARGGASGS